MIAFPLWVMAICGIAQASHRWTMEKKLKLATELAVQAGARVDGNAQRVIQIFEQQAQSMKIRGAQIHFVQRESDQDADQQELLAIGIAPAVHNRLGLPNFLDFSSTLSSGTIVALQH